VLSSAHQDGWLHRSELTLDGWRRSSTPSLPNLFVKTEIFLDFFCSCWRARIPFSLLFESDPPYWKLPPSRPPHIGCF